MLSLLATLSGTMTGYLIELFMYTDITLYNPRYTDITLYNPRYTDITLYNPRYTDITLYNPRYTDITLPIHYFPSFPLLN
ncbi:hypothetical protein Bpfe_010088 [Biomphalaria pfeifferi]|uniref:Uncharacterized protein n=1 Tax=Biomphalaria pfeifferi TaxID=112525 RepID=A0AAD8FDP0_BIOPF|nr:hypothetical protein Bpfe_010088 [Biomphalaria pfeifferi]